MNNYSPYLDDPGGRKARIRASRDERQRDALHDAVDGGRTGRRFLIAWLLLLILGFIVVVDMLVAHSITGLLGV